MIYQRARSDTGSQGLAFAKQIKDTESSSFFFLPLSSVQPFVFSSNFVPISRFLLVTANVRGREPLRGPPCQPASLPATLLSEADYCFFFPHEPCIYSILTMSVES